MDSIDNLFNKAVGEIERMLNSKDKKANFMAAIRQPAFRRRMLRFVSDVWRAIHKKNVELN